MQKRILFGNLKGGTGKSNVVFQLASILGEIYNKKVLIIDLDAQANSTSNFSIDSSKNQLNISDIFYSNLHFKADEIVLETKIKNVDIIPSSLNLIGVNNNLVNAYSRELILNSFFNENSDFFSKYDYIIFDTAPYFDTVIVNSFFLIDSLILISDTSFHSLEGAEMFLALYNDALKNLKLDNKIKGFLVNNIDMRIKLSGEFIEYIKKNDNFKNIIFNTSIPSSAKLKESEVSAIPLCNLDIKNKAYEAYKNLIDEMQERGIL